ncbi:DUF2780 domain-containing protein [Stutzerimonas kirkiae]|uniref:DUF2780 domain-containing protein n=1 Tax=Stutzerimonas kirkiae TaxID=2211392 RepID=A0A4Q9R0A8_9GAMM|nr:DUF2780 domain-containing protein [Stutzerimonas kirkiae]TBU91631.1 hypothetical protein DNJ96_15830 [Stutzerimonas kirkiae]TBV00643.1 hypothetical protein DNJ95_14315 [Stutzerimonas kirkiae]TBV10805.1 hypothetical protein DNK08_05695 [Stutzerimonas kirkiae]TBV14591.1 hypothetical protein DNK01_08495 [Stutzerimonas kirkiae]
MKNSLAITIAAALAIATGPASAFDLGEAAKLASAVSGNQAVAANSGTLELLGTLSNLDVTPQQAAGGTTALLKLAESKLTASDYTQLAAQVPGLEKLSSSGNLGQLASLGGSLLGKKDTSSNALNGVLENVQSLQDVNKAFSALGMDNSLVGQFSPIILQYLGNQGLSTSLLQSLSGIWGVSGS